MDLTGLTAKWTACRSRSNCGTQQEARQIKGDAVAFGPQVAHWCETVGDPIVSSVRLP